jgi:hypothetical protein
MKVRRQAARAVLGMAALALSGAWLCATPFPQAKKKSEPPKKAAEPAKQPEPKAEPKAPEPPAPEPLFTSFRKADARGTQTQATASAGAKGAKPFGKQAGAGTPSAAAFAKLATLESAKPTPAEIAAFLQEGQLKGSGQ